MFVNTTNSADWPDAYDGLQMIRFPMNELAGSRERLRSSEDPNEPVDGTEPVVTSRPSRLPWYRRWMPKDRRRQ